MNERNRSKRRHKFLTAEILKRLPGLGETDGQGDEAVAQVKFFSPYSGVGPYYVTEFDPETNQAFGFTVNEFGGELGYMCLAEMEACTVMGGVPAIERDCHWSPRTLGEIRKEHERRAA